MRICTEHDCLEVTVYVVRSSLSEVGIYTSFNLSKAICFAHVGDKQVTLFTYIHVDLFHDEAKELI